MKRGERQMWTKLARAVEEVAKSTNYAEEYIAKRDVAYIINSLKDRNINNIGLFESLNLSYKKTIMPKGGV